MSIVYIEKSTFILPISYIDLQRIIRFERIAVIIDTVL